MQAIRASGNREVSGGRNVAEGKFPRFTDINNDDVGGSSRRCGKGFDCTVVVSLDGFVTCTATCRRRLEE